MEQISGVEAIRIALDKAGIIAEGVSKEAEIPSVPKGWEARFIQRTADTGTIVLVPTSPKTRATWREGQVLFFEKALSRTLLPLQAREVAEQVVDARLPKRHELAGFIGHVVSDAATMTAYRKHPGIEDYRHWREVWLEPVVYLGSPLRTLSPQKEAALAEIVKAIS